MRARITDDPYEVPNMSEEEFSILRRESENFFRECVEAVFVELLLPPKEFAYQVRLWDEMGQYEASSEYYACNLIADVYGGPVSLPICTKAVLLYEPGDMYWQAARITFGLPGGRRIWAFACYRDSGHIKVSTEDPPQAAA